MVDGLLIVTPVFPNVASLIRVLVGYPRSVGPPRPLAWHARKNSISHTGASRWHPQRQWAVPPNKMKCQPGRTCPSPRLRLAGDLWYPGIIHIRHMCTEYNAGQQPAQAANRQKPTDASSAKGQLPAQMLPGFGTLASRKWLVRACPCL